MNNKGYYRITNGKKHMITDREILGHSLYMSDKNITHLLIPDDMGIKHLYCSRNYLTKLVIPNGVEYLYCYGNPSLKELILPDNVTYIMGDIGVLDITKYIQTKTHITLYA